MELFAPNSRGRNEDDEIFINRQAFYHINAKEERMLKYTTRSKRILYSHIEGVPFKEINKAIS